jgi:hypothetical protein
MEQEPVSHFSPDYFAGSKQAAWAATQEPGGAKSQRDLDLAFPRSRINWSKFRW